MFIHFYAHDILIFVLNYDKNSLNNNVPNDTLCHWPKCECIQTFFCNLFEFPTTIPTNNIIILFTF